MPGPGLVGREGTVCGWISWSTSKPGDFNPQPWFHTELVRNMLHDWSGFSTPTFSSDFQFSQKTWLIRNEHSAIASGFIWFLQDNWQNNYASLWNINLSRLYQLIKPTRRSAAHNNSLCSWCTIVTLARTLLGATCKTSSWASGKDGEQETDGETGEQI